MFEDIEDLSADRLSHPDWALVVGHYQLAAPLLEANFSHVPLVSSYHPQGLGTPAVFKQWWKAGELPPSMPAVDVVSHGEHHTYIALTVNSVLWLAHRGAVGMMSWTPSPRDPECVAYARILMRLCGTAKKDDLKYALLALQTLLRESRLEAIPMLDGHQGAALFVPFADIPLYDATRAWLHSLCNRAAERHPELLTVAAHDADRGNRVHLSVTKDAVGGFSSLPYSVAGNPELGMATPVEWNELGEIENGMYTAHNSAQRLQRDVFAEMAAAIGMQRFSSLRA